jgi:hypothetical protein
MSVITREHITRALNWLAAHPDNHIGVELATNDRGSSRSTLDPEATCFCALGRIAVEAGIDTDDVTGVTKPLEDAQIIDNGDLVWNVNDEHVGEDHPELAIAKLRELLLPSLLRPTNPALSGSPARAKPTASACRWPTSSSE